MTFAQIERGLGQLDARITELAEELRNRDASLAEELSRLRNRLRELEGRSVR